MPKAKQIDLTKVEELAATLPTVGAINKALGVNVNYVQNRCKVDFDFKAVFERGRNRFKGLTCAENVKTATWNNSTDRTKVNEMSDKIRDALKKGISTVAGIEGVTGIDRQTLLNMLTKWVERGEVVIREPNENPDYSKYALAPEKPAKPKTDRDGFESGCYQESPHRQKILDSLEVKKYQLSRHLCQNTGLSIDDVLAVVDAEGDADIGLKFTGGVMVYFLRVNEPKGTLYNTGDNSFAVKEPDEPKPDGRANNKPPKRESKVTAETVEQCALDGLSLEETAVKLGIAERTAQLYLQSKKPKPQLYEAWKRGKQRRKEMIESIKPMKTETAKSEFIETVGELAEFGNLPQELNGAKPDETSVGGFGDEKVELNPLKEVLALDDEDFDAVEKAIDDLVAQNGGHQIPAEIVENLEIPKVETDSRFEHTLEHISTNGHSRAPLEKVKAKLLETKPVPVFTIEQTFEFNNQVETVNHPQHYNTHPSGVECIEVVEHFNFNLGNAIKYIWRADEKGNAIEDLEKAAWYVQREIEKRLKFRK